MKPVIIILLLFTTTNVFAEKSLQCERYREVHQGDSLYSKKVKEDRTVFTLTFSPEKQSVTYKKLSGPEWVISSGTILKIIWKAKNDLRVVAFWINSDSEINDRLFGPVYIFDIDFQRPKYEIETYGGVADYSPVLFSPWEQECLRLD